MKQAKKISLLLMALLMVIGVLFACAGKTDVLDEYDDGNGGVGYIFRFKNEEKQVTCDLYAVARPEMADPFEFFSKNNISTWRSDFEPILSNPYLLSENRHYAEF